MGMSNIQLSESRLEMTLKHLMERENRKVQIERGLRDPSCETYLSQRVIPGWARCYTVTIS